MRITAWIILLGMVLTVTGCNSGGKGGSAPELLPDVPNATLIEGKSITDYIGTLAEGKLLLAGNPALAAAIKFAEGAVSCYQNIGAVAVRVYTDKAMPLSSGLVAIIDRNAIADPANLTRCFTGSQGVGAQSVTLQVCSKSYTLKKEDNEFYIAYVGTTKEMCQAFCSGLEGCSAQ